MVARLFRVIAVLIVLKLVVRFVLIGAFTPSAVALFTVLDVVAVVLTAPWVAAGPPLPARPYLLKRAFRVASILAVMLALTNVALQLPLLFARSRDTTVALIRVATEAIPNSLLNGPLVGPLWGIAAIGVAGGFAFSWLLIRVPADRTSEVPAARARRPPVAGGRDASSREPTPMSPRGRAGTRRPE